MMRATFLSLTPFYSKNPLQHKIYYFHFFRFQLNAQEIIVRFRSGVKANASEPVINVWRACQACNNHG